MKKRLNRLFKGNTKLIPVMVLILPVILLGLGGCDSPEADIVIPDDYAVPLAAGDPDPGDDSDIDENDTLNPGDYPDPPENQILEFLSIYIAWNGPGGETWDYEYSAGGIVEECGKPAQPEEDDELLFIEDELPGGRTLWFKGVSPGDVVLTFTTQSDSGETVDIQQYAIRVFDDLRLGLLHTEHESFRD